MFYHLPIPGTIYQHFRVYYSLITAAYDIMIF